MSAAIGLALFFTAQLTYLTLSSALPSPQVHSHNPQPSSSSAVPIKGNFYLERSHDQFGVRSHGIIERTASGSQFHALPQSDVETYKKLRSGDLQYMAPYTLTASDYHGQEVMGPYQVEGERVWFGNEYYDSEGERGVGAFGYFDMRTRQYVLFYPPEIVRFETSAILVERDAVWLALDHFGEDISTSPVGLLRWNKTDRQIRFYPLEFVVSKIRKDSEDGAALRLTTRGGYALFRNGDVKRFRFVKSSNGKTRIVPIKRFPPPPSIF